MRHFFIFLITLYQRYISPYKGFRCAYAACHDSKSCSAIIKNIIVEHGLLAGWPLIKQQFNNCHLAYQALETEQDKQEREKRDRRRKRQCYDALSDDNQYKCECRLRALDACSPDVLSDGIYPCNYVALKKSIHITHIKTNKYGIKSNK